MHALADQLLKDPASLPYPPLFPVELALRQRSPQEVCEAYGIDQVEWDRLRYDPTFISELKRCVSVLREEGMTFRVKARLQSEALLQTAWHLIHSPHNEVPPAVKADLIKFTIRAAGLDGSKDQGVNTSGGANLQINLVLT